MALTCDWALFCERAHFDPSRKPGNLNIVHVMEQVRANGMPTVVGSFMLVAHLADYGTFTQPSGLQIVGPGGEDAFPQSPGAVSHDYLDPYLLFTFSEFTFRTEGIYRFEIVLGGTVARVAPLVVASLV
jgi:hypothetical protein